MKFKTSAGIFAVTFEARDHVIVKFKGEDLLLAGHRCSASLEFRLEGKRWALHGIRYPGVKGFEQQQRATNALLSLDKVMIPFLGTPACVRAVHFAWKHYFTKQAYEARKIVRKAIEDEQRWLKKLAALK